MEYMDKKINEMVAELSEVVKVHLNSCLKTCCNCHHFKKENDADFCTFFEGKPPARIVVKGCDHHAWEIPF